MLRQTRVASWSMLVLLLTGIFHLVRGAPLDAVLFFGMGVALALDARFGARLAAPDVPTLPSRTWPGVVVAVLIGLLLGFASRRGLAAHLVIPAIGVATLALGWGQRDSAGVTPRQRLLRLSRWVVVALVLCLWELVNYLIQRVTGRDFAHPAMSDLMDPLLDVRPLRAGLVTLWLLGGIALLRLGRGSHRD
ncbi:hypothetical protein JOE57_002967 [Microlunatus panaciterrae]|uniref:Uncharacterized protein n=1 Tax=Microlunatus panaciterrae TaxID=400768 RepID=A0ABS2RM28_9ACTN|nr:hypothetical protein [Microlunatus panaciterrae]MBM7800046.1 hypothetical protein [Microlunatus panaciterrae]